MHKKIARDVVVMLDLPRLSSLILTHAEAVFTEMADYMKLPEGRAVMMGATYPQVCYHADVGYR